MFCITLKTFCSTQLSHLAGKRASGVLRSVNFNQNREILVLLIFKSICLSTSSGKRFENTISKSSDIFRILRINYVFAESDKFDVFFFQKEIVDLHFMSLYFWVVIEMKYIVVSVEFCRYFQVYFSYYCQITIHFCPSSKYDLVLYK